MVFRPIPHVCQFLTTVSARQEEFPALSYALMVIALSPTNSGIAADHEVVPLATPALPVEVVHFTELTPV